MLDFEQEERLEVAVEERAPWVSFSFGVEPALVARARGGDGHAVRGVRGVRRAPALPRAPAAG